jgi:hypothetical protein
MSRRQREEYQAPQPIVVDAYQGQGGSYILDLETGVRTPVQPTLPPDMAGESETQEVNFNGTSDTQASDSGASRIKLRG